jgi:hypothetical protein
MNKRLTPCQAIHKKCIECSGGNQKAPLKCQDENCPLWHFRMGHNPMRQGIGNKKDFDGLRRGNLSKKGIQYVGSESELVVPDGYEVIIRRVKK